MPELLYETDGPVGTITLNRPERLNAVTPELVDLLDAALAEALADKTVRVIRLRGAGRAFCAGYDLTWAAALMRDIDAASPWDPMEDYENLSRFVRSYMSLWHSPKPVVAQVHGVCVGGGSDLALCSDLIVCADDCRIGYPPARIWGSPTTAMWFYRVGLERAKRLLLTGDPMDGRTAVEWGFASGSYPADRLDEATMALCRRIAMIPANQLRMMKLLVNNAVEQLGLASTQLVGTLLDGAARHTPEGSAFSAAAAADLATAIAKRDKAFGDYGFGARTVADSLLDQQSRLPGI
ncbi:MAG TPA: crotonase/enoyl-CoA hydratase family protein [Actinophytocola sp.]|uniref:crotonase/enoyl-CoA hydratase family protein n=1 Tax=Actinophytocola sp. TaxID=1872138 RepID=UPI002DDD9500|nr:crotonase/enoyl-CoA hydratase family protein [Actinophytocola sp.]HEV2780871.1 crotonase/enoyl-CoA hydratase family protein [Actinophytocola sp.]